MKDAIGGSSLLNLVVIFTSVIIIFFAGMIVYSKAYKIKNRIIEVIEKHGEYDSDVINEINDDLIRAGYRTVSTNEQVDSKCNKDSKINLNDTNYFYCVYRDDSSTAEGYSYEVVTYVHFDFPVISSMIEIPVRGETKILGKSYDY